MSGDVGREQSLILYNFVDRDSARLHCGVNSSMLRHDTRVLAITHFPVPSLTVMLSVRLLSTKVCHQPKFFVGMILGLIFAGVMGKLSQLFEHDYSFCTVWSPTHFIHTIFQVYMD